MNINIDHTEARRLRLVLSEAFATAERMAVHPEFTIERQCEFELTATVCLSVINKIADALLAESGEV